MELPCDNWLFSCCFQDSLFASALWVLLQCVSVQASFGHLEFGCLYPALGFRSFLTFLLGLPRNKSWSTCSCFISIWGFPHSSLFFFLFALDLIISSDLSSNSDSFFCLVNSAAEHSREFFNLVIVFFSSRICLVLFYTFSFLIFASLVAQKVKNHLQCRWLGSIPGLGKSPGEGNGNPLQYSCLDNSIDKRSLVGYTVHGVTKS